MNNLAPLHFNPRTFHYTKALQIVFSFSIFFKRRLFTTCSQGWFGRRIPVTRCPTSIWLGTRLVLAWCMIRWIPTRPSWRDLSPCKHTGKKRKLLANVAGRVASGVFIFDWPSTSSWGRWTMSWFIFCSCTVAHVWGSKCWANVPASLTLPLLCEVLTCPASIFVSCLLLGRCKLYPDMQYVSKPYFTHSICLFSVTLFLHARGVHKRGKRERFQMWVDRV